jgi:hypothetical protein
VGQLESQRLDLGLGAVQFGLAQCDLPTGLGGVFLCLTDEFLDPIRECRIEVKTRQFSVQIHAKSISNSNLQSRMNSAFPAGLFAHCAPVSTRASVPVRQR